MNFIEAVKKALFEESRKYSKAQERNLSNLFVSISKKEEKLEDVGIARLDEILKNQNEQQSKATGEYGYWGIQNEIDTTEETIVELRRKHVEFLYKRFGYKKVKSELDRLQKIEETEKALEELKLK